MAIGGNFRYIQLFAFVFIYQYSILIVYTRHSERITKTDMMKVNIYSKKYDVSGFIEDYGVVTKIIFSYHGRQITMGINRIFPQNDYEKLGQELLESYIENLSEQKNQIRLYNWYVKEYHNGSTNYLIGKGIVTGHPRIPDTNHMSTSNVRAIYTDLEHGEVILTTMNHIYHCPLEYCCWLRQDEFPGLIPDYNLAKEKFQNREDPSIESGKVLLVLSDHDEYYFHSLYYKETEEGEPCHYCGNAHVGMFQDSYLIHAEEVGIDLRYFPHFKDIEFYSEDTDGRPLYLENVGDSLLFAKTSKGVIRLHPGERKEVCKEHAEEEPPVLPNGDLYPAVTKNFT